MFYRGYRSFASLRYFTVSCSIILAVDVRRVKRDSKWTFERWRTKFEGWCTFKVQACRGVRRRRTMEPDKGVRGRLRDGEENRRDGCVGFLVDERRERERVASSRARRVVNRKGPSVVEKQSHKCYRWKIAV